MNTAAKSNQAFVPFDLHNFNLNKFFESGVGFDEFFRNAESITKNLTNYPPYNIKKVGDNKYVIEMAVAGFAKSDIEIVLEGNKLTVSGATKDDKEGVYLHKGIANRNFVSSFNLADKVEITGESELSNGMLKIWLDYLVHTNKAAKKITIR